MSDRQIDSMQIKLIHIAKAQLKLSDEEYRTLLMERYPNCFGSCKDLSYAEATDLLDYFKSKGFVIKGKRRGAMGNRKTPGIIYLPSPQQLLKIEHLRKDIRWHVHDGFDRWLKKYLKKDSGPACPAGRQAGMTRIATGKEANNVIEALKGMLKRQQERADKPASCQAGQPEGPPPLRDGYVRGKGKVRW